MLKDSRIYEVMIEVDSTRAAQGLRKPFSIKSRQMYCIEDKLNKIKKEEMKRIMMKRSLKIESLINLELVKNKR